MGTSLKRIELDLKTPTVRSQEHTPRFKKKLNHHAAQETDGARGRRLARREGGSIAGHENGRVAKPKSGTGRDRIVGRGLRKHATRDPNEWGDDIPLWESHPSRSHATAREKTPRQRRLEKSRADHKKRAWEKTARSAKRAGDTFANRAVWTRTNNICASRVGRKNT